MNADRWRQIDDLFQQALEVETELRLEFVKRATSDDELLRSEVLTLLDAGRRDEAFLDRPIHGGVARLLGDDASEDVDPQSLIGQRIGAYQLQSLIAVGGMGAVYVGVRDDDEFNRTVAVKVLRRSLAGSSGAMNLGSMHHHDLRRRFQLERQVLANLDHPNIARLIDGGTCPDGRPYLVMEYVSGVPIDMYCTTNDLPLRRRLLLFMPVCEAVQHAHRHLVIHRDLKPSNILVAADGTPKLLDFGVAKLLQVQASRGNTDEASIPHAMVPSNTVTGAFMGTFAYAAPEQVSGSSGGQDTRSDVYALGLILYRLLTGVHAYDINGPVSQVVRNITELDPKPPSVHNSQVNGELDTIVLKSLMKDQQRRYQSAGDLAADIDRLLRGEPILARGDSRLYILRKTVRRYRVPLAFAAMLLFIISTFAVLTWKQSQQLAQRGEQLTAALRLSNIERGRLMGRSGNLVGAEAILWAENKGPGTEDWGLGRPTQSSALSTQSSATARLAHWALWELYANQPCVRTYIDAGARTPAPSQATSPDGRFRYELTRNTTGQSGGNLRRIDLNNGDEVEILGARGQGFNAFALSHDGRYLAVDRHFNEVVVIDAADPAFAIVAHIDEMGGWVTSLAFAPGSGKGLGDVDWGLSGSDQIHSTQSPVPSTQPSSLLAIASVDKVVRLVEVPSGLVRVRLTGHLERASVIFSDDGQRLISVDRDGLVREWEMNQWLCTNWWRDQPGTVFNMKAVSGQRSEVSNQKSESNAEHSSDLRPLTFDLSTPAIAACYGNRATIQLLNATNGEPIRTLEGHTMEVTSIAVDPKGRYLVSSSYDRTVRWWSLAEGDTSSRVLYSSGDMPFGVTVSPDGERLAIATDARKVIVLDAATGATIVEYQAGGYRIPSLDWSPDGRWLAFGVLEPGSIELIDLEAEGGGTRYSIPHSIGPRIVRFNRDGTMLASGAEDGVVRLWRMEKSKVRKVEKSAGAPFTAERGGADVDVSTFRLVDVYHTLTGHQQDVFALDFSPDGSILASGGRSGEIRLWDVESGQCLATLQGHRNMVFTLLFLDDRTLLSGGREGIIGSWDLTYYDRHIEGNRVMFQKN